jgi:DNA-binding XRE family transcriptional regulator
VLLSILPENFSRENISCKMSDETDLSWLVNMRKALGLTQEDVATALGVTPRTIINWENGHHEPKLTIKQTKALCRLLNVSIEQIPDSFPLETPHTKNA